MTAFSKIHYGIAAHNPRISCKSQFCANGYDVSPLLWSNVTSFPYNINVVSTTLQISISFDCRIFGSSLYGIDMICTLAFPIGDGGSKVLAIPRVMGFKQYSTEYCTWVTVNIIIGDLYYQLLFSKIRIIVTIQVIMISPVNFNFKT